MIPIFSNSINYCIAFAGLTSVAAYRLIEAS